MSKDFTIHQDGDRQIIERLSYPRFKGVVTFNGNTGKIKNAPKPGPDLFK